MKAFTALLSPAAARERFAAAFHPAPLGIERVRLFEAHRRVLAEEIRAGGDLPAFPRSTVDGYAVRAADTEGASSGKPVTLALVGEVSMGEEVTLRIDSGETARMPTGGAIPAGADAVVMQEHTVRADSTVTVERSVRSGDNVVPRGADVRRGDVILHPGRRIRAHDLGLLAGLNRPEVSVYRRPHVGVIVTGDELVAPGQAVHGSQIHDMNSYTLSGLIDDAGGLAQPHGIIGDNLAVLMDRLRMAHAASDAVILAGGSSVGEKDLVADAIAALGAPGIVVHGIAIRPGKPTILAVCNGKPVFGLPGNVVSAMVTFDQFVRPVIQGLAGLREVRRFGLFIAARLTQTVAARDREDHARVALEERDGAVWAAPLPAGSAIITSMVKADGFVVVPMNTVLEEGTEVEVRLLD
jgi:molybdopterin molybdotransferase